jgi:hypothetical protein
MLYSEWINGIDNAKPAALDNNMAVQSAVG